MVICIGHDACELPTSDSSIRIHTRGLVHRPVEGMEWDGMGCASRFLLLLTLSFVVAVLSLAGFLVCCAPVPPLRIWMESNGIECWNRMERSASKRPAGGPPADTDGGKTDKGGHGGGPKSRRRRIGRLAKTEAR